MATTFAGKQPGYSDPTMDHESVLKVCTETFSFIGKAASQSDPTIVGCIPKIKDIDAFEQYWSL